MRRVAAEALALVGYRRFRRAYWRLRARDMQTRYAHRDDFSLLRTLIGRYQVKSVADIGCGEGRLFPLYKEAGIERLYAVEMSRRLHDVAARRVARGEAPPDSRVVLGDVTGEAGQLAPSDLVIASRTLQHIPPEDIGRLIARMAQAADKAIYVNEMLARRSRAAYIFLHDYDALFAPHGFVRAESGRVPGIDYEYRLYVKRA